MIKTLTDAAAQLGLRVTTGPKGFQSFPCPECHQPVLIWKDGASGICSNHEHCRAGVWNNFRLLKRTYPGAAELTEHLDLNLLELEQEETQLALNELIHASQVSLRASQKLFNSSYRHAPYLNVWKSDVIEVNAETSLRLLGLIHPDYHKALLKSRWAMILRGTPYYVGSLVLLEHLTAPSAVIVFFRTHQWQQTGLTRLASLINPAVVAYDGDLRPPISEAYPVGLFDSLAKHPGYPVCRTVRKTSGYQHFWLGFGLWAHCEGVESLDSHGTKRHLLEEVMEMLDTVSTQEAIDWLRRLKQAAPDKSTGFLEALKVEHQLKFQEELSYRILYTKESLLLERTQSTSFVKHRSPRGDQSTVLSNFVWTPDTVMLCEESKRMVHSGTMEIGKYKFPSQLDDTTLNTPTHIEESLRTQLLRSFPNAEVLPAFQDRKHVTFWAEYVRDKAKIQRRKFGYDFLGWSRDRRSFMLPGWVVRADQVQHHAYCPVDSTVLDLYTEIGEPAEREILPENLTAFAVEVLGTMALIYHQHSLSGMWRSAKQVEELRTYARAWGQVDFPEKLVLTDFNFLRAFPCLTLNMPVYADLPAGVVSLSAAHDASQDLADIDQGKVETLTWMLVAAAKLCLGGWAPVARTAMQAGVEVCEALGVKNALLYTGYSAFMRLGSMKVSVSLDMHLRVIRLRFTEESEELDEYIAQLQEELIRYCGACKRPEPRVLEAPDLSFMSTYRSVLGQDVTLTLD